MLLIKRLSIAYYNNSSNNAYYRPASGWPDRTNNNTKHTYERLHWGKTTWKGIENIYETTFMFCDQLSVKVWTLPRAQVCQLLSLLFIWTVCRQQFQECLYNILVCISFLSENHVTKKSCDFSRKTYFPDLRLLMN